MNQVLRQFNWVKASLTILFTLLTATSIGWFADQTYYFWDSLFNPQNNQFSFVALAAGFVGFFFFSYCTLRFGFKSLLVRSLRKTKLKNDYRVLIASLSPGNLEIQEQNGTFYVLDKKTGERAYTFTGSILTDIQGLTDAGLWFNWQQNLRALANKANLEKIYVLTTEKADKDFAMFKKWLLHYYQEDGSIRPVLSLEKANNLPIDANDMASYYNCIDKVLDLAKASLSDLHEKQIIVDVTGGQVPASIGGVMATLHNNVSIQYVGNDTHVHQYFVELKKLDD